MPENSCSVLIVPGLTNSGPDHWQTLWEKQNPNYVRVQQRDWNQPNPDEWVTAIGKAVAAAPAPVVLVGHSLGCIAIARWAKAGQGVSAVAGALLVAPADPERPGAPKEIKGFAPMPLSALPFPSIFVASSNDPYSGLERARFFAKKWGSRFVDAGALGHLNAESRLGDWPTGQKLLAELLGNAGC
jgi:predicted alpha/beta hydrolase family esterase